MSKTLWRVLTVIGILIAVLWGGLGVLIWSTYHAAEYPGASQIAASDLVRLTPNLAIKRIETYRTTDAFNEVYTWYSQQFDLGPERFAQSNCLLMARSSNVVGPLNINASVMVCNTKSDRMMFVQRTYILRYPDWLRRLL